jgi:phosphoglycolate phosphatase-like HAD superfamily hydrolase
VSDHAPTRRFEAGWRKAVRSGLRELEYALERAGTVAWDFDGVVAATEPLHERSYQDLLAQWGLAEYSLDFSRFIGRPELKIWEAILRETKLDRDPVEARRQRLLCYLELAETSLEPYSFVAPLLAEITARPGSRNIVISSQEPNVIDRLLRQWKLNGWVGEIQTGHDPSVVTKDELIRRFADREPGGILLEDSMSAIELGVSLGLTVVAVAQPYNRVALGRAAAVIEPAEQ